MQGGVKSVESVKQGKVKRGAVQQGGHGWGCSAGGRLKKQKSICICICIYVYRIYMHMRKNIYTYGIYREATAAGAGRSEFNSRQ